MKISNRSNPLPSDPPDTYGVIESLAEIADEATPPTWYWNAIMGGISFGNSFMVSSGERKGIGLAQPTPDEVLVVVLRNAAPQTIQLARAVYDLLGERGPGPLPDMPDPNASLKQQDLQRRLIGLRDALDDFIRVVHFGGPAPEL